MSEAVNQSPKTPHTLLQKLRYWLIIKLAGNDAVCLNLDFYPQRVGFRNSPGIIHGCTFYGSANFTTLTTDYYKVTLNG